MLGELCLNQQLDTKRAVDFALNIASSTDGPGAVGLVENLLERVEAKPMEQGVRLLHVLDAVLTGEKGSAFKEAAASKNLAFKLISRALPRHRGARANFKPVRALVLSWEKQGFFKRPVLANLKKVLENHKAWIEESAKAEKKAKEAAKSAPLTKDDAALEAKIEKLKKKQRQARYNSWLRPENECSQAEFHKMFMDVEIMAQDPKFDFWGVWNAGPRGFSDEEWVCEYAKHTVPTGSDGSRQNHFVETSLRKRNGRGVKRSRK